MVTVSPSFLPTRHKFTPERRRFFPLLFSKSRRRRRSKIFFFLMRHDEVPSSDGLRRKNPSHRHPPKRKEGRGRSMVPRQPPKTEGGEGEGENQFTLQKRTGGGREGPALLPSSPSSLNKIDSKLCCQGFFGWLSERGFGRLSGTPRPAEGGGGGVRPLVKSPAAAVGARVSKPLQNFFGALAAAAPHSATYWCRQKSKV